MLNISAPALANASNNIATEGPGTLFCASGGYRWFALSDLDVTTEQAASPIKCVFCFFEQDDYDAIISNVSIFDRLGYDNSSPQNLYSVVDVGTPSRFYSSRAPPL